MKEKSGGRKITFRHCIVRRHKQRPRMMVGHYQGPFAYICVMSVHTKSGLLIKSTYYLNTKKIRTLKQDKIFFKHVVLIKSTQMKFGKPCISVSYIPFLKYTMW